MHINGVHKKPFSCTFPPCNRQFHTEVACRNHQKLHDPSRPIQCEMCPQRYKKKCELQLHVRQTHSEAKDLECPHCDYRTNQRGQLRGHLKRMHQAEDVACPEPGCDYQSCSPADMMKHSQRHDEKSHPFKCEYCPNRFTHSSSLKKHENMEHATPRKTPAYDSRSESGETPKEQVCQLCGCVSMDKTHLERTLVEP